MLPLYPRATHPRRRAICNIEFAFCYANRREANPAANAGEALRLLDAGDRDRRSLPARPAEGAGTAFERVFGTLRARKYAELRAGAVTNLASVLLLQDRGSRELNRVRACTGLDEAVRTIRSLPRTP